METRTEAVRNVITHRFDQYVEDLQRYLRQPGVSSTGFGIRESAALTAEYLRPLCGEDVRIVETDGHPVVLGRATSGDPSAKTLLVYSFYDLVPAADEDEWLSPPFDARIVNADDLGLPKDFGEVLCGRGSIDHRGPLIGALCALSAVKEATGDLPINVIFVIEGEEEVHSPSLAKFVHDHHNELKDADAFWLVRFGRETPTAPMTIHRSYAGNVEFYLTIESGEWGGTLDGHDLFSLQMAWVDAPLWRLVRAVATLTDADDRIAIDDFWDHVRPMGEADRAEMAKLAEDFDEDATKRALGIARFRGGATGPDLLPRYVWEPRLRLNAGVVPGLPGEQYVQELLTGERRAELAMRAHAHLRLTVTPDLEPDLIITLLRAHLDRRGFPEIQIQPINHYTWSRTDGKPPLYTALERSCETLGIPHLVYPGAFSGAPFGLFNREPLGLPMIAFGGGHGGKYHEVNEYITIDGFREFIDLAAIWFQEWAAAGTD